MKAQHFILVLSTTILGSILPSSNGEEYTPIVELRYGKIRGLVKTVDENKLHVYQGIRYARAERFSKPELVTSWPEEIYDATKDGNSCPQFMSIAGFDMDKFYPTNKSEDCLFLNVFKPISTKQSDQKLPVMVWIYGGGFQIGTIFTPIYDGSYLATTGNVIVVAINYRLGPLGFLYTGTKDAPGNLGFYDQITALKWVHDNIESFGGDPNQVTIFGESAGGLSVTAMILSPVTKGLFQRAIVQSGSIAPSGRFLLNNKEKAIEKTKHFAEKLECIDEDMTKLVECLRKKSVEEIRQAASGNIAEMMQRQMIGPIIGDEVLPEKSINFDLEFNEVDLMFGVTRDEGSLFIAAIIKELTDDKSQFSKEKIQEIISNIVEKCHLENPMEVVDFYTKNLDTIDIHKARKILSDFYGDLNFNCPTMLFGKRIALRSNPQRKFYAYRFDRRSFASSMMRCEEWMGVCHAAELLYVFSNPQMKLFQKDHKVNLQVMKAWTEFAKTGNPGQIGSIEWPEVFDRKKDPELSSTRVMSIDLEFKILENPFKEVCDGLFGPKFFNLNSEILRQNQKQEL